MTTEIKTLLENAARAAGIEIVFNAWVTSCDSPYIAPKTQHEADFIGHEHTLWNPATNSGDSRDLQVALKISLCHASYDSEKEGWIATRFISGNVINFHDTDPNMAVLLVASAIGAAMKEGEE